MALKRVFAAIAVCACVTAAQAQDRTYSSLIDRYYSSPKMQEALNNAAEDDYFKVSITGRFNGADEDRLTIFPVESSLTESEDLKAYGKMLIKSEKGTVPNLIIEKEKDEECLGFGFDDVQMDDIGISLLDETFEKRGPKRHGVLVTVHPEGSTVGKCYTYLLRNGQWTITPPVTPYYMDFAQCAAMWPEDYNKLKINGTWCKNWDGAKQSNTVALFPQPSGNYQIKMNTKEGDMVDNESGEVIGTPVGVGTYPDWWEHGEELLLVELAGDTPTAKLYRLAWEVPDASYMNGKCTYDGSSWLEVGTAVRDEKAPTGWRVTKTDAEMLRYQSPWWNY